MSSANLAALLQAFFTDRLIAQRQVSPHTVASYRDTFRLLLQFTQKALGKSPSQLGIVDLSSALIGAFLNDLEKNRANASRSRNLRLTAIRSFFRYAALECPEHSAGIQRVLAIPPKRQSSRVVDFLTRPEIEALLEVPDQRTWLGRRDRLLLLFTIQTGLRLSELIGLRQCDIHLERGAHVRCEGKGRKQRSTPLTRTTVQALKAWVREEGQDEAKILFPSAQGGRLSHDSVQYLVSKYAKSAAQSCATLHKKRVTPHVLRHTTAMELLQAGVDRSVIALWLGHESVETTQIYLDANLALKEEALKKTSPVNASIGRFKPDDQLLSFLRNL
ncbi:MAG TPA: tyrosine-type recombinase/integrase [Bryobacteraceae bacterium]|jgi:site-specific recombinase XerD|nr:tyrosine-type recombinase/integrase [Bryobacteraceae bacterium]